MRTLKKIKKKINNSNFLRKKARFGITAWTCVEPIVSLAHEGGPNSNLTGINKNFEMKSDRPFSRLLFSTDTESQKYIKL